MLQRENSINRRLFLALAWSLTGTKVSLSSALAGTLKAPDQIDYGLPVEFSFEKLQGVARQRAIAPYTAPRTIASHFLKEIDYVAHNQIFQPVQSGLFASPDGEGAVTLLHLARLFPHPVRINLLQDGFAREIRYRRRYFRYPRESAAFHMPEDAGFAGFRVHRRGEPRSLESGRAPDWMSFLGASYFRASGDLDQYGASARGLAIDTAAPGKQEEFPIFTEFWIEKKKSDFMVVYALLESRSVTGAYSIEIQRLPKIVTTVRATVFPRHNDIACLGLAPLTSMYWYSETNRWIGKDWRPEVHDSDGLLMHTGAGEWIWRPLNNPPRLCVSTFLDEAPRGFGLLQRDRSSASYLDPVAYHRRPNIWVEPLDDWSKGAIQLVEIPTDSEYVDNIVAYFKPAAKPRVGSSINVSYRLHWNAERILPLGLAQVTAVRTTKQWPVEQKVAEAAPVTNAAPNARTIMIEFKGDLLGQLGAARLKPVVEGAMFDHAVDLVGDPDGDPNHLRLIFNVGGTDRNPTEIRAFLLGPDGPATATVLTQIWL